MSEKPLPNQTAQPRFDPTTTIEFSICLGKVETAIKAISYLADDMHFTREVFQMRTDLALTAEDYLQELKEFLGVDEDGKETQP
jgi:hypothetical protein